MKRALAPGEYLTSKGHLFGFAGWRDGDDPLSHYDDQNWTACLHGCLLCLSLLNDPERTQEAVEDDGLVHELLHLVAGVHICLHNDLFTLRDQVEVLLNDFNERHL